MEHNLISVIAAVRLGRRRKGWKTGSVPLEGGDALG